MKQGYPRSLAFAFLCIATAAQANVDAQIKKALNIGFFPKPSCSADYGKIDWNGLDILVKDLQLKPKIEGMIDKQLMACIQTPAQIKSNPNFINALKTSCDNAPNIQFDKKKAVCEKVSGASDTSDLFKRIANDLNALNKMLPSRALHAPFYSGLACPANAISALNVQEFAQLMERAAEYGMMPNLDPKLRTGAKNLHAQGVNFWNSVQKCSKNASDPNFNTRLKGYFSDNADENSCDTEFQSVKNPGFKGALVGVCKTVKATAVQISNNNTLMNIRKALNVPSTPMGYMNLPVALIKPLLDPNLPTMIKQWGQLDPAGLNLHFRKITDAVKMNPSKIVHPNAVQELVNVCQNSSFSKFSTNFAALCRDAKETFDNNVKLYNIDQHKKNLGANLLGANPMMICSASTAEKLNEQDLQGWMTLDPEGAQAFIQKLTGCFIGNASNEKSASVINAYCEQGLNKIPAAAGLCQAAQSHNARHTQVGSMSSDMSNFGQNVVMPQDVSMMGNDSSWGEMNDQGNRLTDSSDSDNQYGMDPNYNDVATQTDEIGSEQPWIAEGWQMENSTIFQ